MSESDRLRWAGRCNALFGLVLLVSTWKLWTPYTEFPQIPVFEFLIHASGTWDWLGLATLVAGLLGALVLRGTGARGSAIVVLLAGTGMVLLNQHRLQPWMYLLLILTGLALTPSSPRFRLGWMRAVIISVYFYSAISKLDYQFLHSTGLEMVDSLAGLVGLDSNSWPGGFRHWAVLALPSYELVVAALLVFPKTRRAGVVAAAGLHMVLILVLGPWGLHHQQGVLVWNAYFLVHNGVLFGRPPQVHAPAADHSRAAEASWNSRDLGATLIGGLVLLFPLGQLFGWGDHWLAWEVYAPRTSRARLVFQEVGGDWMPDSLDRLQSRCSDLGAVRQKDTVVLSPARGSLATLGVPGYPQARFEMACLVAIDNQLGPLPGIVRQYQVGSVADRWTGQRPIDPLNDADAVRRWMGRYWINVRARTLFRVPGRDAF